MRALTPLGKAQWALLAALALSVAIGVGWAADTVTNATPSESTTRATLSTREATAGPVQIKVTPVRLDRSGAAFTVVLDNHEVDLTMDLARGASLTVGSRAWGPATWSGDGPSGHHREGTLTFPTGGAAAGEVALTLAGFAGPVQLQWTLPEGGARS
jgi:hypothetical protein